MNSHDFYHEIKRERIFSQGRIYMDKVLAQYSGNQASLILFSIGDGVGVVPITSDKKIILVQEFRVGAKETQWNLPGGGRKHGEPIEETAKREYYEETGGTLASLEYLGRFTSLPAFLEGELHYYIGWDATLQHSTETNVFLPIKNIRAFNKAEIENLIDNNMIPHTGSLAAILLVLRKYPDLSR